MKSTDIRRARSTRFRQASAALLLSFAAASCSIFNPPGSLPIGASLEQARQSFGGPTGRYRLDDGGTRLEYASPSFGKQTWMLDFDANGRLVAKQQVLDEAHFAQIVPGLSQQELLFRLGHPAWIFGVGRQNLDVWNYRFAIPLGCTIFQVSVLRTGVVKEASQGWDPACDAPNGYL